MLHKMFLLRNYKNGLFSTLKKFTLLNSQCLPSQLHYFSTSEETPPEKTEENLEDKFISPDPSLNEEKLPWWDSPVDTALTCKDLRNKFFRYVNAEQPMHKSKWESLAKESETFIPELNSFEVASILQSCKNGRYTSNEHFLKLMLKRAKSEDVMKKYDEIQIAMCVHAWAHIVKIAGKSLSDNFRKEINSFCLELTHDLTHIEGRLEICKDQSISMVMYGLGILYKIENELNKNKVEISVLLEQCLKYMTNEIVKQERMNSFTQQALANIIYGAACMEWRSEVMLNRMTKEACNRKRGFNNLELSNIIYSIGKLDYVNDKVTVIMGLEAIENHRLKFFTNIALGSLMYGIAKLINNSKGEDLVDKMRPIIKSLLIEAGKIQRTTKYTKEELVNLICNMGLVAKKDVTLIDDESKNLFYTLISKYLENKESKKLIERDIVNVLTASARLDVYHQNLVKEFTNDLILNKYKVSSIKVITLILWSLSTLRVMGPSIFVNLCERLLKLRKRGQVMTDANWVQLTQAAIYMSLLKEKVEISQDIRDLLEYAVNHQKSHHKDREEVPITPENERELFLNLR